MRRCERSIGPDHAERLDRSPWLHPMIRLSYCLAKRRLNQAQSAISQGFHAPEGTLTSGRHAIVLAVRAKPFRRRRFTGAIGKAKRQRLRLIIKLIACKCASGAMPMMPLIRHKRRLCLRRGMMQTGRHSSRARLSRGWRTQSLSRSDISGGLQQIRPMSLPTIERARLALREQRDATPAQRLWSFCDSNGAYALTAGHHLSGVIMLTISSLSLKGVLIG